MSTLVTRINDFAKSVQTKFNQISVRLMPMGGTTNQVLTKKSNTDNDVEWKTPTGITEDEAIVTSLIFGG